MNTKNKLTVVLLGLLFSGWAIDARSIGPGTENLILNVDSVTFELVRIPAGTFLMGSEEGDSDEQPVHEVRIEQDFYMGKTEVTVGQFGAFILATGYRPAFSENQGWIWTESGRVFGYNPKVTWFRHGYGQLSDEPVITVTWEDAVAFCRWLSEKTNTPIRLPTEAEWEYACRAGGNGNEPEILDNVAWHAGNSGNLPHPVAHKQPNAWGLYDMLGNASEWCLDTWHRNYERAPTDGTAWLSHSDPRRVARGGEFRVPPERFSFSRRYRYRHIARNVGLRIVHCPGQPVRDVEATRNAPPAPARSGRIPEPTISDSKHEPLVVNVNGVAFEFVRVEPGEFLMGSENGWSEGCREKPVHRVSIDYSFDLGKTEITVAQFRAFIDDTRFQSDGEKSGGSWIRPAEGWRFEPGVFWWNADLAPADDHPAVCVSWFDAVTFCEWLSQKTGQKFRLPSEAEWEYACRAGTTGDYAGQPDQMGWHRYNSNNNIHPVAQKQPNAWGLYDMHGSTWEWCRDVIHETYNGAPTDGSAWMTCGKVFYGVHDDYHVLRGGAWCRSMTTMRSASRYYTFPDCSSCNIGFRIVRVCTIQSNIATDQQKQDSQD